MSIGCQARDCKVMAMRRCYLPSLPVQSLELCSAHAALYLSDGTLQVDAPSLIRVVARPASTEGRRPSRLPATPSPPPRPPVLPVAELAPLPVPEPLPPVEVSTMPAPAAPITVSCRVGGCLSAPGASRGLCTAHYARCTRWLDRERRAARTNAAWGEAIAAQEPNAVTAPVSIPSLVTRDEAALVEAGAARLDLAKALGVEDAPPSLTELVIDIVNELKQTREDRDGAKLERAVAMAALDDIDAALLAAGLQPGLTGVQAAIARGSWAEVDLLRSILPQGWTLDMVSPIPSLIEAWEVRRGDELLGRGATPVEAVRAVRGDGSTTRDDLARSLERADRLQVQLDAINEELSSRGYVNGLAGVLSALSHVGEDSLRAALPHGWELLHDLDPKTFTVSPISPTSEALPGLARETPVEAVRHWLEEQLAAERPRPSGMDELHEIEAVIDEHDAGPHRYLEGWTGRLNRILCPQERYRVHLAGHRDLGIIHARRTPAGGLLLDDGTLYGPCAIYSATLLGPAPEPTPGLRVQVGQLTSTVVSRCDAGVLLEGGMWASWAQWRALAVAVACADGAPVTPPAHSGDRSYSNIPF